MKKKTRRDTAEIARENLEAIIGEKLTGEPLDEAAAKPEDEPKKDTRNIHAVALSKLGASRGGKARSDKLSAERRREIAEKAARVRWKRDS